MNHIINIFGLVLGMTGTALVFFFSPQVGDEEFEFFANELDARKKYRDKFVKKTRFGFVLIFLGFLLQFTAEILSQYY